MATPRGTERLLPRIKRQREHLQQVAHWRSVSHAASVEHEQAESEFTAGIQAQLDELRLQEAVIDGNIAEHVLRQVTFGDGR